MTTRRTTWNQQLTGPLTTPDGDAPVRGRVREGGSHNPTSKVYVRGRQGSSTLYPLRSIEETVAAHKGNLFTAAYELNELGVPPRPGRATWTASGSRPS
jgi:hypothetical protein